MVSDNLPSSAAPAPQPVSPSSTGSSPASVSPEGKANGKCVAALVLGICAFVIPFIGPLLGIIALIFGIMGLHEVKRTGQRGHALAVWGIVLGAVGIVFGIVLLFMISALAYFGVLAPDQLLPERTTFSAPFMAPINAGITGDGTVRVVLINAAGATVSITGGAAEAFSGDCAGGMLRSLSVGSGTPQELPVMVENGQDFVLEFQCSSKNYGDAFDATMGFTYTDEYGLERSHSGSVYGTVG